MDSFGDTIEVADLNQDIEAEYWVGLYTKEVQIVDETTEDAAFTTISSPSAEVLGSDQNPLAQMDDEELIELFAEEIDNVTDVQQQTSYTREILDEERTVKKGHATVEVVDGIETEFAVELASFAHEDDYLVLAGGHPMEIDEEVDYESLMTSIDHPVEPPEEYAQAADDDGDSKRYDDTLIIEDDTDGSIETDENVLIRVDVEVDGDVRAGGTVELESDAEVDGVVEAAGDVTLGSDSEIDGDVTSEGDVIVESNAEIDGEINANGEVETDYSADVDGEDDDEDDQDNDDD